MDKELHRLPSMRLQQTLQEAARNELELKARQRTSGKSGQLSYEVKTGSTWDSTGSVSGWFITRTATVTLTSESDWPIAIPVFDWFFNGTGQSNRPSVGENGGFGYRIGGSTVVDVQNTRVVTDELTSIRKMQWRQEIMFVSDAAISFYLKVRLRSSSKGTLQVVVS